jgi:hypothetical protein
VAKRHALDIGRTLSAIDQHDLNYYDGLTPEEQKGFHPTVVVRFVSSASGDLDDWNLIATNERANRHLYDLYDYTDLQYRLLASVGLGMRTRHDWIAGTKSKSSRALTEFLEQYWPDADELGMATILQRLRHGSNLKEFLAGTGLGADEVKRVTKLFAD